MPGTDRVKLAARSGGVQFVLLAADASETSREKLLPVLERRKIPFRILADREILGDAVGRPPLSAVAVLNSPLAGRIRELLEAEP